MFLGSVLAQIVKKSAYNVGDEGSVPGLGRSPGGGHGNPLQYSCLEKRSYVGGVSPWCESGSPGWFVKAPGAESASGSVDLVCGLRICISCNDVTLPAGLRTTLCEPLFAMYQQDYYVIAVWGLEEGYGQGYTDHSTD